MMAQPFDRVIFHTLPRTSANLREAVAREARDSVGSVQGFARGESQIYRWERLYIERSLSVNTAAPLAVMPA